jgi:hypothetical protein
VKYIFVAGAPGSKWSGVVKNIYYSDSIDRSDYSEARTYYGADKKELMHMGAYWDPGMEFNLPERMSTLTKTQAEQCFDAPFTGQGVRIIKSHIFSYKDNIDYLKEQWPNSSIVLVYRPDDACLGWWTRAGHFDITYPNYRNYYVDFKTMADRIQEQNKGITSAILRYPTKTAISNQQLARILGIATPPDAYWQNYGESGVRVEVI